MRNKIKTKAVIALLFIVIKLNAQTYNHTTVWARFGLQKTIKNWEFNLEHDIRQQNSFQKPGYNPLSKPLLRWLRITSTYEKGNFAHTIVLPNYIVSYPLVGNLADMQKTKSIEWRFAFLEEYSLPVKNFTTSLRAGYEFRNITNNQISRNTGRLRIRLSENLKTSKNSSLNLSFEPLYNVGPNKAVNTFSQYQAALKYNQKFGQHLHFTTGFNHLLRKRNTLVEYDLEDAIICNFSIDL